MPFASSAIAENEIGRPNKPNYKIEINYQEVERKLLRT